MASTGPATIARVSVLSLLALLASLAFGASSARARIVLLSSSSGAPSPLDANLYDWRGQWTSALDRAAPVPGQRPAWQVNVGLYGDWYTPPGTNVIEQDPTCEIALQIDGAPVVYTSLNPCVEGHGMRTLGGLPSSPVPELLTPNLAAASNGPHTVTITAYNSFGDTSKVSFNADVDNILPSPANMTGPVGWQAGGEVIRSTAATYGPSGIGGQSCSIGSSTPGWYAGASALVAVNGNGQIPVRCTAQNNAGVPGPTTEHDAMLDNSPPSGYFAPRNPNDPAQATVMVADALSGVAGGQIQIQTAGGWRPLATSYNSASGELTATLPDDGNLPDGNYALRAVVSDAVGNTATVTTDQNGTSEIVTVPLRIVTQLAVGRSQALIKRCTLKRIRVHRRRVRHQRVAARLVRRCSELPVPRHSAIVKLRFHQQATVHGLVQTADRQPVADAPVQVIEQAPGWRTRFVQTVLSDSQGEFTYTIPAGPSRMITFRFPGSPTLRASAGTTTVHVFGKARIKVTGGARAGRSLRISGRVRGGYIPSGGVLVQLQYQVSRLSLAWAPFHTPVRTDSHGRFSVAFPLPAGAAGYTYMFRALVAGQNGWPFLDARSNPVARAVT